ncbi:hypothetical protein BES34_012445 [Leptospira inadai serovar Lyme]|uniref:Uncharacterized protein n=1 Tax=Leptospira inadai serovar Lyme TaxID=293084 RepID=A0ABX4YIE4_9LEPT|nr:hypothetical protein BES34_012445 [Leptospira inadai serovar Lyme]
MDRTHSEDRGQRTEDRGQRTEDRGQRTEDRGQTIIPITLTTIFLKTNYVGTPTPRKKGRGKIHC